ncbi:MAG: hypothetical protein ACJ71Z_02145 [Aeromicrobium sp.]
MDRGEPKEAPSQYWYLAALALVIVGWMVGVAVAGGAWDAVRHARISSTNEALQAQGSSVAVFTDVVQPDRQITCTMTDVVTDSRSTPVPPAPIALEVEDDGTTWHLVAFQPEGRNGVTVTCAPADKRVDNAQYAFATVDGFTERARVGNAVILASLLGAALTSLIVFVRRRRALRQQR